MAETFYGPWIIVLNHVRPELPFAYSGQRFTISESDNADGQYTLTPGASLKIGVEGEEWRIQIEYLPRHGSLSNWRSSEVHRATKFVAGEGPGRGLVVQLDAEGRLHMSPPGSIFMRLTCTSMDPTTNPISTANPYDFTIPD